MNFDPDTDDGARNRSIVKIVGGLAVAGVVIGLLAGVLGASAIRAIGLKPGDPPVPASAPATPAPSSQTEPTQTEPTQTTPTPTEPTQTEPAPDSKPHLNASPSSVAPGERINLSGAFPGVEENTTLQVQRREDGEWEDFPVAAKTHADGTFTTWVLTSRAGKTKFRMLDEEDGKKTPPATVQIG